MKPRLLSRIRPTAPLPALLLVLAVLGLAVGCGDGLPKRVPISGVVTVDGQPIPGGQLMFVPEGSRPSSSEIGPDGRFTLQCFDGGDGAVLGTHRLKVFACQYSGSKPTWYAPKKYADFRTSGLTYEVTEADDDVVIELTWDGEKRPRN